MLYADIILPLPIPGTFTYAVPSEWKETVKTGMRAIVPFGSKRIYTGIIVSIHKNEPKHYEPKKILSLPDEEPILRAPQYRFWEWISEYYIAHPGEVYQAAVPSGFKLDQYKPKTEAYIRLSASLADENKLLQWMDKLLRAPKQLELLIRYLEISEFTKTKSIHPVPKKQLLGVKNRFSPPVLNGLVDKGIFEIFQQEVGRLKESDLERENAYPLNASQQKAMQEIEKQFNDKQVVLLHGVTSSGKTEIYIHLIEKVLAEGKQVLYLAPEIALTAQLTTRLRRVFGNKLGVYHSKFSDAERVEIWNNVLHDESYEVILGVRSSVFLPFRKLGLIIVDEEHEPSFKQYDPAPRYHARNAAIVLASLHGAKTLLGTATPSIESYHNAKIGKYGLVELHERYEEMQLPEILVVDMKEAYRKKQYEGHFSDVLIEKINLALQQQEQVILFQNRRGYAPFVECKACAYVPKCKNCDVSLTLHAAANTLNCHYCGYVERLPQDCPSCKAPDLRTRGFGTEKIEEEIKQFFPDARVMRMDLDTTRSKKGYARIISAMERRQVDILIGTQMVTKGLDFEKVSLVGILNADNLLSFPDFRSYERAFQLMAQVSGRAGRKHKKGLVVIQTYSPDNSVIQQVVHHDYQAMFDLQIQERASFQYPPFYRMIQITLKHRDFKVIDQAANELAATLRTAFGSRVLGPAAPLIARVQNQYIRQILFKFETAASVKAARTTMLDILSKLNAQPEF
ncbi:MAG TPA: primosomal protein N', partial [Paludibacter sp.]|nr:primosomal protein N' [Paludibacter sp.]